MPGWAPHRMKFVDVCEVGGLSTMGAEKLASRFMGVLGGYLEVGFVHDSGCRRRVGSNGAHDGVCCKVPRVTWARGTLQKTARMESATSRSNFGGLGFPGSWLRSRPQLTGLSGARAALHGR